MRRRWWTRAGCSTCTSSSSTAAQRRSSSPAPSSFSRFLPAMIRSVGASKQVLRIHDILVWIRIRGSMPQTNGSGFGSRSGSSYFRHWPANKKQIKKKFFAYYFLKVHLHHFSKIKGQKEVVGIKVFFYFCMMMKGSGAESGSGSMSLPNPDPDPQHCSRILLFINIFRKQMVNNCIHVQVKSEVGRRGGIPLVMAAIRFSSILPWDDLGISWMFLVLEKFSIVSPVLLLPSCLFRHVVY